MNNTLNRLKVYALERVLSWILPVEEYGVTFDYLQRKNRKMLLRMLYPVLTFIF
jgi:hypothetical protein